MNGVVFDRQSAQRIASAVRRLEGTPSRLPGRRGRYPVLSGSKSGGAEIIHFRIIEVLRGVGLDCNACLCEVINTACGMGSPAIGDEVPVWDGLGCNFNLPESLLIGLEGYAMKMTNPNAGGEESDTEFTETGPCRWEVQRMCCAEESG